MLQAPEIVATGVTDAFGCRACQGCGYPKGACLTGGLLEAALEGPGKMRLAGKAVPVGDLADIQARSLAAAQQLTGLLQAFFQDEAAG